jgi:ubiquinone/menaquinone biosynthesis C-methylase UbiE
MRKQGEIMDKVDYSKVAARYDDNLIRHQIPRDEVLAEIVKAKPAKVLDLGCGTGTNLAAQQKYFDGAEIEWIGLDPSPEMLSVARSKVANTTFFKGFAEAIPFAPHYFDYVVSRFAVHHFSDKEKALQEIHRVLRPGGTFKIVNIAPDLSPDWWIFRYFPETREIDQRRFWSVETIKKRMQTLGFLVTVTERPKEHLPTEKILFEARNRDTSQLVLLEDELYRRGLKRLEEDVAVQDLKKIDTGLTLVEIVAKKERT